MAEATARAARCQQEDVDSSCLANPQKSRKHGG
eukprot:CAMPEP_0178446120 /NCGR_PEP_ID=MMETSP0689_2-20121128/40603_1 /TAXON_ID=160604 /ORGANISM="Amphidinium massartii, Strain CS-259" /LENGTH=32 /DNA_ID= /DNA_START= /DNA_END= /DNA_ORIENTATION=